MFEILCVGVVYFGVSNVYIHFIPIIGKELCAERVSLEELLKQSDFVIVTCSLTESTKGLFNKEKFALMKPSAIFVNISRGGRYYLFGCYDVNDKTIQFFYNIFL